jgi:hypothetical protein
LRWMPGKDTVCVQTCKPRVPAPQRVARFMNNDTRQMSFYAAIARFRIAGRLTGFPSPRNIVRIRTNGRPREGAGRTGAF